MTAPPSPSVDPVRERITEIQQRIAIGKERAEEDTGDGDAIISAWSMFAAVAEHDTPALVAALTAVLDLHQPDWRFYGDRPLNTDDDVHCKGCAMPGVSFVYYKDCKTVAAIAAGLGVTP